MQRFAGQGARYACGWRGVWDRQDNLCLDLADPFATEERWQEPSRTRREFPHPSHVQVRNMLEHSLAFHDRGCYEAAAQTLDELAALQPVLEPWQRHEYQRLFAWVQCRRGYLDGIRALDRIAQSQPPSFSLITDYVCTYRYQGLVPPPAIDPWIENGRAHLSQNPELEPVVALVFLGHYGYTLMRNGRPDEALKPLEQACQSQRRPLAHPHSLSRALAELADVHRALGNHAQARQELDEAQALQLAHGFEGDLADFALTYRAKLETDPERVRTLLAEIKAIQTRLHNRMGEARTLLLAARLGGDVSAAPQPRLLELRHDLPALRQCRLLSKILSHWDAWVAGAGDPDGGVDSYWWL